MTCGPAPEVTLNTQPSRETRSYCRLIFFCAAILTILDRPNDTSVATARNQATTVSFFFFCPVKSSTDHQPTAVLLSAVPTWYGFRILYRPRLVRFSQVQETTAGPGLHNRHFKYTATGGTFMAKVSKDTVLDNFVAEQAGLEV